MNDTSRTNDQTTIQEQLWAEPDHADADLLASNAGLQDELQAARDFNGQLTATIGAVPTPDSVLSRALEIPEQAANDDNVIRRLLPVAAVLLLAISLGLYFQPAANASLAEDIFGHIYVEEAYYGDGSTLATEEVNARMNSAFGTVMKASANSDDELEFTFAKDCYIAKQMAMHLVVKGESGPVNLMMIPEHMVDSEMKIVDQRFSGMVIPASGGTLVVVGNKKEAHLDQYRDRFANSLEWEY